MNRWAGLAEIPVPPCAMKAIKTREQATARAAATKKTAVRWAPTLAALSALRPIRSPLTSCSLTNRIQMHSSPFTVTAAFPLRALSLLSLWCARSLSLLAPSEKRSGLCVCAASVADRGEGGGCGVQGLDRDRQGTGQVLEGRRTVRDLAGDTWPDPPLSLAFPRQSNAAVRAAAPEAARDRMQMEEDEDSD